MCWRRYSLYDCLLFASFTVDGRRQRLTTDRLSVSNTITLIEVGVQMLRIIKRLKAAGKLG